MRTTACREQAKTNASNEFTPLDPDAPLMSRSSAAPAWCRRQQRSRYGEQSPRPMDLRYDSAVAIDAPAGRVWAYAKQPGQTQAGRHSLGWLERIFTFGIHDHCDVRPEWQGLKPGDYQRFHQAPRPIGERVAEVSDEAPHGRASRSDTAADPGRKDRGPNGEAALKLWFRRFCRTWNRQAVPVPRHEAGQRRLVWRCDCAFERYRRASKCFVAFIPGTAPTAMGRRYMDAMKALAEGRMTYPDSKR